MLSCLLTYCTNSCILVWWQKATSFLLFHTTRSTLSLNLYETHADNEKEDDSDDDDINNTNDDDDSNNNNEATRMTVAAIQQNDARLLLCNFSTCINLFGLKHVVLSHPQPTHKNISLTSVLHRQYQWQAANCVCMLSLTSVRCRVSTVCPTTLFPLISRISSPTCNVPGTYHE